MCTQLEISARRRGSRAPCGTRYILGCVWSTGNYTSVHTPRSERLSKWTILSVLTTEFYGGGWKLSWPALLSIKNTRVCTEESSECDHGTVTVLWLKSFQFSPSDEALDPSSADGMVCSKVHGSRCFRGTYWYGFQLWTICSHYKIFQLQGQYSLRVVNHWVTYTACSYSLADTEQML